MQATHCSAVPTLLSCPSSQQPTEIEYDPPSDAADLGTAVHVALADYLRGDVDAVDTNAIARAYRVDANELAKLFRSGVMAYEQIRDSVVDVRVEVPIGGHPLVGRADAVLWLEGGGLGILDWKSNREKADVEPQLLAYASCLEADYGFPSTGTIKLFTIWLRLYEIDVTTVDSPQLDRFRQKIERARSRVGRTYAPGDACTYCKRQMECEARRHFLTTSASALVAATYGEALAETLPRLYERSRALNKALDDYRAALRMLIRERGPLDDGSGGTLTMETRTRQSLKPQETWAVLQEFGFDDGQIAACMDISKTAIMDTIAAKAPRGQKAKRKAELQSALEAKDAIVRSTYETIKLTKG